MCIRDRCSAAPVVITASFLLVGFTRLRFKGSTATSWLHPRTMMDVKSSAVVTQRWVSNDVIAARRDSIMTAVWEEACPGGQWTPERLTGRNQCISPHGQAALTDNLILVSSNMVAASLYQRIIILCIKDTNLSAIFKMKYYCYMYTQRVHI